MDGDEGDSESNSHALRAAWSPPVQGLWVCSHGERYFALGASRFSSDWGISRQSHCLFILLSCLFMFLTLTEAQVTSGVEAAGLGSGGPHSRPSPAAISRGVSGKRLLQGPCFLFCKWGFRSWDLGTLNQAGHSVTLWVYWTKTFGQCSCQRGEAASCS